MKNIYRAAALNLMALSLAGFTASAQTVTLLYSFGLDASKGKGPVSGLVADQQGALYGTTYEGGANGYGTIFKLTPPASTQTAWTHTILYNFCSQLNCYDGSYPTGGLIFGADGALYGVTTYGGNTCGEDGCGTIFKLTPPASDGAPWTYAAVYRFQPPCGDCINDGTNPTAGLIIDRQGVFYGTTNGGGYFGHGTVFRLRPDTGSGWQETPIYLFGGGELGDGAYPAAGLTFGKDMSGRETGVLYGTTYEGGAADYGTIYQLTPPGTGQTLWTETVLHSFTGGNDGAYPMAGLFADNYINSPGGASRLHLYGTTTYGGVHCSLSVSCGTIFAMELNPSALVTVHSFGGGSGSKFDGANPLGRLVLGDDGALYGTTEYGGSFHNLSCGLFDPCGTIFRLNWPADTANGWKETVLHRFCDQARYSYGCTTGAYPTAGLLAYGGALYGTTSYQGEGAACDCGTVFKLDYGETSRTGLRTKP